MNRYQASGPSKATSSTVCQKCLKRGHYSYECSAPKQDRPYSSRPSRTQQLLNPKLAPKIVEAPVKRTTVAPPPHGNPAKKHSSHASSPHVRRRRSSSSSDSVATISTQSSRSRSPLPKSRGNDQYEPSHELEDPSGRSFNLPRKSRSPNDRSRRPAAKTAERNDRSRSPDRRGTSPIMRSRSRSPYHTRPASSTSQDKTGPVKHGRSDPRRERSLSPYSKRLALTRAGTDSR